MNFPLSEYWSLYLLFTLFVLTLVAFDLGLISKAKQKLSTKQALLWSVVWVSLGLLVGVVVWQYSHHKFGPVLGRQMGLEYFSGFLIEKALAIDNIFVFVLIFTSLKIPQHLQRHVLGYGILGALVFRAIFISIGAALMQYKFMLYVFGAFLIFTGIKMVWPKKEEKSLEESALYRFVNKMLPFTSKIEEGRFWIYENGKRVFTPLFLALILIELSDIVFAIDSVPAIFAITKEPFIVFTSNMMAILGLRSLYLVLADAIHKFEYLKYGLAFILVFVGAKMVWLNDLFNGHFPITWSLAIIAVAVTASIFYSLYRASASQKAAT